MFDAYDLSDIRGEVCIGRRIGGFRSENNVLKSTGADTENQVAADYRASDHRLHLFQTISFVESSIATDNSPIFVDNMESVKR